MCNTTTKLLLNYYSICMYINHIYSPLSVPKPTRSTSTNSIIRVASTSSVSRAEVGLEKSFVHVKAPAV